MNQPEEPLPPWGTEDIQPQDSKGSQNKLYPIVGFRINSTPKAVCIDILYLGDKDTPLATGSKTKHWFPRSQLVNYKEKEQEDNPKILQATFSVKGWLLAVKGLI